MQSLTHHSEVKDVMLLTNDCLNGSPGLFWSKENPVSTKLLTQILQVRFSASSPVHIYIRVNHTLPLVNFHSLTLSYWYAAPIQIKIYNLIHPWPFSKLAELRLRVKLTIMPENECWKWEQVSARRWLCLSCFLLPLHCRVERLSDTEMKVRNV